MKPLTIKEMIAKDYTFYEIKEMTGLDTRTLSIEYQKLNLPLDFHMNGQNDYAGEEKLIADLFTATMLRYSSDLLTQNVSEKTKLAYTLAGLKTIYSKEPSPVHTEVNINTNAITDQTEHNTTNTNE